MLLDYVIATLLLSCCNFTIDKLTSSVQLFQKLGLYAKFLHVALIIMYILQIMAKSVNNWKIDAHMGTDKKTKYHQIVALTDCIIW